MRAALCQSDYHDYAVKTCSRSVRGDTLYLGVIKQGATRATGLDLIATVNYHRYAKQSSAELIAEGAIS